MAVLATVLATYEFVLGRRNVQYYADSIDPCVLTGHRKIYDLRKFLGDNEERIVLVDLVLNHDGCDYRLEDFPDDYAPEDFPQIVSFRLGHDRRFDEKGELEAAGLSAYSPKAWEATLTIVDAEFDEAVLATSSFGDGFGVQRARGLVYIANEGDEGLNAYRLVPVPFSFEAERVYRCTLALAEENILLLAKKAAGACVLT